MAPPLFLLRRVLALCALVLRAVEPDAPTLNIVSLRDAALYNGVTLGALVRRDGHLDAARTILALDLPGRDRHGFRVEHDDGLEDGKLQTFPKQAVSQAYGLVSHSSVRVGSVSQAYG